MNVDNSFLLILLFLTLPAVCSAVKGETQNVDITSDPRPRMGEKNELRSAGVPSGLSHYTMEKKAVQSRRRRTLPGGYTLMTSAKFLNIWAECQTFSY